MEDKKLFNNGLVEVRIAFTTKCSAACTTCLNSTIKKHYTLSLDLFKSFINQILSLNIENPIAVSFFQIGEVYLHPNFIEMVEWAIPRLKDRGITTTIITNGSHVTKIPVGIDNFTISFNAGKKETYEKITNLKYQTVVDNIKRLYQTGEFKKAKKVEIDMLCFDENRGEEEDFKKIFKGMKNVLLRFSYKYDNQLGRTEHKGIKARPKRIPCDYVTNKINLYPNGDIYLCAHDFYDEIHFGNLRDNSLIDILKSKRRLELIKEHNNCNFVGFCKDCDYNTLVENSKEMFVFCWADPLQDFQHKYLPKLFSFKREKNKVKVFILGIKFTYTPYKNKEAKCIY